MRYFSASALVGVKMMLRWSEDTTLRFVPEYVRYTRAFAEYKTPGVQK